LKLCCKKATKNQVKMNKKKIWYQSSK